MKTLHAMNSKHKRSLLLLFIFLNILSAAICQRGPQDSWYLDREVKLPVLPHMHKPHGFSIAQNGDIYVPQIDLDNIAVWSPTGEFKFVFGKGGSGTDQLNGPIDCFVYQQEVFVADWHNHRIQVYDVNGSHLRGWGTPGSGDGQFRYPRSVYVHQLTGGSAEVYVSEWDNHRVQVFDLNGSFIRKFGSLGTGLGQIKYGSGLIIASDGLVYVSSWDANEIQVFEQNGTAVREIPLGMKAGKIDLVGDRLVVGGGDSDKVKILERNGTIITTIGDSGSSETGKFNTPIGVAVDSSDHIHVACRDNHRIQVFDASGNYLRTYGKYGTGNVDITDLIYTPEGTFLATDTGSENVIEFDENGSILRFLAGKGSNPGEVENPCGIALAPNGKVYVSETSNHRIQVFDRNGTLERTFGSSGSDNGKFNEPWGIDISQDGEVFVADSYNHRIQVFSLEGSFLRSWGTYGSLDGQLKRPLGLAIDDDGSVVVADFDNNRAVVFDKNGTFLRKWGIDSYAWHVSNMPSGLIMISGQRDWTYFSVYSKSGTRLKYWKYHQKSGTSPVACLPDGTLVQAHRGTDQFLFYRPTYRTIRPNVSQEIPFPEVLSVGQRQGTTYLDITYRINDEDSSTVEAALLAFVDGGNDLSKVIVPKTFVGDTTGKLGQNVSTGQNHTVTWNAGADWSASFGELEMAVLAKDDRDLLNLHFLTLPATDSNSTELKINRSPITDADLLNVWYWLIATGHTGISHGGSTVHEPVPPLGSGFSPTSIPGLQLWLDATDVDGDGQADTLANDSNVSVWVDKAGGDHNASQSDLSKKPVYKTNQLDGKPAIFFDASDDSMATSLSLQWPYTVAVLFNNLDTTHINRRVIQGSSNWLIGPFDGRIQHYAGDWVSWSLAPPKQTGRYYFAVAKNDGSQSTYFVDGIDCTQNSSGRGNPNTIYLGKGPFETANGHIAEVLIFDEALSSLELYDLHRYVSEKWNVNSVMVNAFARYSNTTDDGRAYLLNLMNLREASPEEVTRAKEGATTGTINQFSPTFKVGPDERPVKVNEYGFDTGATEGFWVVPK